MAASEVVVKIADVKEVKALMDDASKKIATMARILSTLFVTEVGQVVPCRQCGCPVVHMEHLSLDEAKSIEAEVRALLNIPATLPDEVYQEESFDMPPSSTTQGIAQVTDKGTAEPDFGPEEESVPAQLISPPPKSSRKVLILDKAYAEKAMFALQVLALLAETDCLMEIWWRCDGEFAPVTFFVNANDVFEWACADCEELKPEDMPDLRAAITEASAISETERYWGFHLWVARKRGMRPQQPAYPKDERLRALFDACGPMRDPKEEG